MDAIRTEHLTKRYGAKTVVDSLCLTVKKGELVSLLGVNGAGKTTTVKLLSCLSAPTQGDAYLNGFSVVRESAAVKAVIGVSPQETAVAGGLSVKENLELMGGAHGFSKERIQARIRDLGESMGLQEVMEQRAGKLSGGWQRRLSIAMALISEPQILFLDEPTLGLDVLARRELWDLVSSLKGRVTVLLTTHYMEEAQALSDRVAIMKEGRLLLCESPEEIMARAQTENFEEAFVKIVRGDKQ